MPTYEYACKQCGEHLDVVQRFTDDALTTCPSCAGSLRKVFGTIGISFKGSGFYKNDSRGSANGAKNDRNDKKDESPAKAESAAKTGDGASSGGSDGSKDAKDSKSPKDSGFPKAKAPTAAP